MVSGYMTGQDQHRGGKEKQQLALAGLGSLLELYSRGWTCLEGRGQEDSSGVC